MLVKANPFLVQNELTRKKAFNLLSSSLEKEIAIGLDDVDTLIEYSVLDNIKFSSSKSECYNVHFCKHVGNKNVLEFEIQIMTGALHPITLVTKKNVLNG